MSNICKTVNLYTRKIKGGKMLSYFLDYYPGYRDETTNKVLRHESLGIYIYAYPKTQREKDYNARLSGKAEALRCRRYEEIVNERYEFFDRNKLNGSFIDYFKKYAEKKNSRYEHTFLHFSQFTGGKCTFAEITVELCNKFLEYLRTTHQVIHTKRKQHTNTIASYWSAFLGTLHAAHRDRKIKENPCPYLERAETIPTDKVGLSAEELIRLAETPCEVPILKTAFLFSCLTGLRKSDVKPFTWEMIQPEADGTLYITDRMQKTKQIVHNPIGDEALALIDNGKRKGLVFPGFRDSMTQTALKQWVKAAGITKHITYHSSRHTINFDTMRSFSVIVTAVLAFCLTACAQGNQKHKEMDKKAIVVYFSATGTTKNVAEKLAAAVNADIWEIEPEQSYTDADLDWNDSQSRSSIEMNNPKSRSAVKAPSKNIAGYDVVFIGYPIWWDLAPMVVNSFIESNNLNGKTVVPFATSGGSGIRNSAAQLKKLYPRINWKEGKLLNSASEKTTGKWVKSLNL